VQTDARWASVPDEEKKDHRGMELLDGLPKVELIDKRIATQNQYRTRKSIGSLQTCP
jgi:hypothetical protein